MDYVKLRAWWAHRQGLDGSLQGAASAVVLERAGWVRSVGGANPYLTLFSRAGISRETADADAASRSIHELPSARGCTYILPAADYALGLKVGQGFGDAAQLATAKKFLGVTDDEIDRLSAGVLDALGGGEKDPAQLRDLLGERVRNLGDAGKKRGITTTLPVALGLLQSAGEIRRVPVDGRLDQQRYRYARWTPSPLAGFNVSLDEAYVELARRYYRWIGPAKAAHFQWFSGLGVRATKTALDPLGLEEIGDGWLIAPEDRDVFESFAVQAEPHYTLVSGLDNIILHRRDLASLVDLGDDTGKRIHPAAGAALGSPDLENQAILDRGRVVGLWEFDPVSDGIVWAGFEAPSPAMKQAVAATESYIREQLGDARSFSLDSPSSRAPRIKALHELADAAG
jgi:hypothetical protein